MEKMMNYSTAISSGNSSDSISSLAYNVTFIVSFVLLILLVLVGCCLCTRAEHRAQNRPFGSGTAAGTDRGINETILSTYPKLSYSKAKLEQGRESMVGSGCPICLVDYQESDLLRMLPHCGHLFHVKCVDQWLKMHTTCPICRTSPIPGVRVLIPEAGPPLS